MKIPYIIFALMLLLAPAQAVAVVPAETVADIDQVFKKLSHDMQCLCGCNATIANCPHANCGYAIPARKMMRSMLEAGKSYDDVIAYFVGKEGEVALSSPTKEGFNLVGYIMPFLAIIAAGSGVVVTANKWAKKGKSGDSSKSDSEPIEQVDDEMAEKLRKELEDFDS